MGGPIGKLRDGDVLRLDARAGTLSVRVDERELNAREPAAPPAPTFGYGRELFGWARASASSADQGACTLF